MHLDLNRQWILVVILMICALMPPVAFHGQNGQNEEKINELDAQLLKEKNASARVRLMAKKSDLLASNEPEAAKELGYQTLRLAGQTGAGIDSIIALNSIGRSFYSQSQFEKAAEFQGQAVAIAERFPDSLALLAKSYNDLGICLLNIGLGDSALELHQKALEIRESIEDTEGITNSINNIAIILHNKGEYAEARKKYDLIRHQYEEQGDSVGIGSTLNNLATLEIELGNYPLGMQLMLDALNIFERLGQRRKVMILANNLSYLYELHEQTDLVEEFNNMVLEIADEQGNPEYRAKALSSMGKLKIKQKKIDEAKRDIREALAIFEDLEIPSGVGNSMLYLADVYAKTNMLDSAILITEEAKRIWRQHGYKFGVAIANTRLAEHYYYNGNADKAIEVAKSGLDLAKEVLATESEQDAYGVLFKAYAQKGDYKKAYEYQNAYKNLDDSLYNAKKGLELARLKFDYERGKDARELKLEQDIENKIKENKLQRQRFIIFGIIAALLITGTIAFSLQRRKKIVQGLNGELEAQKEALEERNEELHTLNQVKDKIFSIISHDLRSPLTTLINMIDISSESEFTQEEIQMYLKELGHQAKHTAGMLDNLLYWVQSQRGSFTIRPELVDVAHTVDELTNLFSLAAKQKNVKLKNQIPIGSKVFVDHNSLKLILRNLLSNAIKFSVRGGAVEIISDPETAPNGMLKILVRDYGVGMSEEQRKSLFKVSGVSKRGTFSEHGIGLGLVLVKEFVDKNNGTISVESTPGEGTTFAVALPLRKSIQTPPSLLDVMQN